MAFSTLRLASPSSIHRAGTERGDVNDILDRKSIRYKLIANVILVINEA